MADAIGKLPECSEGEDWSKFIERLDSYFWGNGVDNNAKKRSVLIIVCGAKSYSLIKNITKEAY